MFWVYIPLNIQLFFFFLFFTICFWISKVWKFISYFPRVSLSQFKSYTRHSDITIFKTFYLNCQEFLQICSHSGMNAMILLDVNSWLLWLIPHHHSGLWAEDFVRIRTPTGPNNGSAEKRRGKRWGGSWKCKFTLSISLQRNPTGTQIAVSLQTESGS